MENLAREVMEETGRVMTNEPAIIAAQDIMKWTDRQVVHLTYTGEADGEVQLSEEHTEYVWYSLEEIKQLDNLDSYFKELLENQKFA